MMTLRDRRLSITIIIIKFPFGSNPTLTSDSDSIRFVTLPPVEVVSPGTTGPAIMFELMKAQIQQVRDAVGEITSSGSSRLGGFVLDMFCTHIIDVADEFGVPSYIFYTSGAASMSFNFHVQFLCDNEGLDLIQFKSSDAELEIPSYVNPVPRKVFPSVMFDQDGGAAGMLLNLVRTLRQVKGIMVNTFVELESHAIQSFSGTTLPPVYSVGPILSTQAECVDASAIMSWLDDQPPSSVIFLCFGSWGSFGGDQVKEIANGLERSGHRFLWSLRQPPPTKMGSPSDYVNVEEVLPEGFLDRTIKNGKVIGWAPQVTVLAHSAIGGFVSHCGWNSTLESIWYAVPMATWPLFADQQLNAFQLVKDLGLAVEIKMDYHRDNDYIVSAQEIEIGLNNLVNMDNKMRKNIEEMKRISRKVMIEGGSSHSSLGKFIEDMINNISCKQEI